MDQLEELGRQAASDPRFAPDNTSKLAPSQYHPVQDGRRVGAGRSALLVASALLVLVVVLLAVSRGRGSSGGDVADGGDQQSVSSVTSLPGPAGLEGESVELVTYPAGEFGAGALVRGTLEYRQGCTFLDAAQKQYSLIWPSGSVATADEDGDLVVRAISGETFAIGQEVELPGGTMPTGTMDRLALEGPAGSCISQEPVFMVAP